MQLRDLPVLFIRENMATRVAGQARALSSTMRQMTLRPAARHGVHATTSGSATRRCRYIRTLQRAHRQALPRHRDGRARL